MNYRTNDSIVSIDKSNGIVKKIFLEPKPHLDNNWLENYKKFKLLYNCVPEVYKANLHQIEMEYIDGIDIGRWINSNYYNITNINFVIYEVMQIMNTFAEYSYQNDMFFYHHDLNPTNVLVDKNNKVMLIEPDEIFLSKSSKDRYLGSCSILLSHIQNQLDEQRYKYEGRRMSMKLRGKQLTR